MELLNPVAVTVVEPMFVIEFPESITVQVSSDTRLVTVQVVLCGLPSYLQDVVPQASTAVFGFIITLYEPS